MSWAELAPFAASHQPPDAATGPTHSQSMLRTFGQAEAAVRVTLYRDNHAWCPYCQKVWLWLEEKRAPYRVAKVSMFCYGAKEEWYKRIVPSGMLPAAEIDGRVVTESDVILAQLEVAFGPLGQPMAAIAPQRRLERQLFSAWCDWLCHPSSSPAEEEKKQRAFEDVLQRLERELGAAAGPWMCGGDQPSTADVIFVPYVERMCASLFYFKAYTMRDPLQRPALCRWLDALEARATYRGTQSDFHTHAHDLPPQMGACYPSNSPSQRANALLVDNGPWVSSFVHYSPSVRERARRKVCPTLVPTSRRTAEQRRRTG
jgi:glutathione S-transferase